MTELFANRKAEKFIETMRPLFLGIPTFLVAFIFLVWSIARLASWVFVVLRANK
jgi:hypothetical protein